jgi:serine-type D-Ala-D-Ala carboxypeptidase (penicillin-binding protein 5/6)
MKIMNFIVFFTVNIMIAAKIFAFETEAEYAILMSANDGEILYQKNADKKMYPSSMSKIMTAYVAFDQIKKNNIKLDDEFVNSEEAWRAEGSRMFIPLNAKVSVENLLRGLIIQSGNDAAITLAMGIAGSEQEFADMENQYAADLNLTNTNYINASGLPDQNHYSSASDLAKIAQATINNFPELYNMYKEKEFSYNNISQPNRNGLLFSYNGADGMKTGSTAIAGYGLVGSAVRNNKRLIVVVNGLKSNKQRTLEAERLLNYGFINFKNVSVAEKNKILAKIPVYYGTSDFLEVKVPEDINLYLPRSQTNNLNISFSHESALTAPINKDTIVGKIIVSNNNDGIIKEFLIHSQDTIDKSGIFTRLIQNIKYLLID